MFACGKFFPRVSAWGLVHQKFCQILFHKDKSYFLIDGAAFRTYRMLISRELCCLACLQVAPTRLSQVLCRSNAGLKMIAPT